MPEHRQRRGQRARRPPGRTQAALHHAPAHSPQPATAAGGVAAAAAAAPVPGGARLASFMAACDYMNITLAPADVVFAPTDAVRRRFGRFGPRATTLPIFQPQFAACGSGSRVREPGGQAFQRPSQNSSMPSYYKTSRVSLDYTS